MTRPDAGTVLQFRSSRQAPAPPGPRDITHVLSMRSGAPDDIPDAILAALAEASVFQVRLPGVGLGLVLDETVEAALREDGFDLTRVAPDPGTVLSADEPVILPLRRALPRAASRSALAQPSDGLVELTEAIDRLRTQKSRPPRPDLQALTAIFLGVETLVSCRTPPGSAASPDKTRTHDALVLERLSAVETALRTLSDRLAANGLPPAQALGD